MPVGSSGFSVPAGRRRTLPSTRITHSERTVSAGPKAGESGSDHALRDAVMVAQVDEQHAAVVADAVAPAGQAGDLADIGFAERAAGMGAITVHGGGHGKGLLVRF